MVPDSNLIPAYPSGGCPSGTTDNNGVMCCCGKDCCWDKCTWDYPNKDCLSSIENAFWMWNSNKQYHTAQTRKFQFFSINYDLMIFILPNFPD